MTLKKRLLSPVPQITLIQRPSSLLSFPTDSERKTASRTYCLSQLHFKSEKYVFVLYHGRVGPAHVIFLVADDAIMKRCGHDVFSYLPRRCTEA